MSYTKVQHGFKVTGNLLDNTDGSSVDLTGMILDVMVKKSYIEDVFPLFVIDFKTTEAIRDQMRDHDVSVALRIAYYNIADTQTEEEIDTSEVVELGVIYEGNIRIYDKPYATTTSKVEEENDDAGTQTESAPFVYYRMSGIPEDLISKNETNVNNIYKNCELIDAVIHMITSIDTTSELVFQESDNKTKYTDILVPPLSLIPAIQFIDSNYYNIYKHDANLFIDSGKIYLYDPLSEEVPRSNILECEVLTGESTGDMEAIQFPSIDGENIKVSYRNLPTYNNSDDIINHNLGSHSVFYYYDENFNITTKSEDVDSYNKVRYLWQKLSLQNHEALRKSESLALSLANINPNLINPLTICRLTSSKYPDAAGDYAVISNSFTIMSTDLIHFKSRSVISLLKK